MGENIHEATMLETTVRRLSSELGSFLKDTTGQAHELALEGEKDGIELYYHQDLDGYENFFIKKEDAQASISHINGAYSFVLTNKGTLLLESARKSGNTALENNLDVRILLSEKIRAEQKSKHTVTIELQEPDLAAISVKQIEKYLF